MIIDDTHRLVFMHIPKCGGTSVHAQLIKWDSRDAWVHLPGHHPELGAVHHAHLPLEYLSRHYPQEYSKVATYRSFAITRDPRSRFASATVQRLKQFGGLEDLSIGIDALRGEANRVADWLEDRGPFCDLKYIHFSRQVDYLRLHGSQIVLNVFALERIADLAAEMEAECGVAFDPGRRENATFASDNRLLAALRLAKPIYKALTSWALRERLLVLMRRWNVQGPEPLYAKLFTDRRIAQFVDSFYADDFQLHADAKAAILRAGVDQTA